MKTQRTYKHRGYEIRKREGRTPNIVSSGGLTYSSGSTKYTEWTCDVTYLNGRRSDITRRTLSNVKFSIDEAIREGHLADKS